MPAGATIGLGRHIETLSTEHIRLWFFTTWIGTCAYLVALSATKVSILLFYKSIFPGSGFHLRLKLVGAFVVAWAITFIFANTFACKPISGSWNVTLPSTCIDRSGELIGQSVLNILADLAILCLPMRPVWRLQLPPRQKVAVLGMFLLGGL